MEQNYWRKCIVCKSEINFSAKYYKCSVSSCDKKRSPAQFCSVDCWDVHRSIMSHKSAGADEYESPTRENWKAELAGAPRIKMVSKAKDINSSGIKSHAIDTEDVLVVVSKLKQFIKDSSGLSTAADVIPVLSDIIRLECQKAAQNAHRDERKTLMARDFTR